MSRTLSLIVIGLLPTMAAVSGQTPPAASAQTPPAASAESPSAPSTHASSAASTPDASEIYRSVAPAVFLIEVRGDDGEREGVGSAFLISDGRLVTNAHVVTGGSPFVRTGAVSLPLTLERIDATSDLAVLIPDTPLDAAPLSLAESERDIGSTVFAVGNPQGFERSISQGLISGLREMDGHQLLQITAAISPGSSGGPIVDRHGQVIAVTVGYFREGQNLNFAVPVARLRELLAGDAREAFDSALLRAQRLGEEGLSLQGGTSRERHRKEAREALDHAGVLAASGDEHLRVATVAASVLEIDRAIRFAERALEEGTAQPDSARAILIRIWRWDLLVADRTPPAADLRRFLAVADTLLESDPFHADAHMFRGQVLAATPDRRGEALPAARIAIEAAARSGEVPVHLSSSLHALAHDVGSAADDDEAFREMVEVGAARAVDWRSHARHLAARQEWYPAADAFREAYRLSETPDPEDICNAGTGYWHAGMNDQALGSFRACIREHVLQQEVDREGVAYAHRGLALILHARGVHDAAESHARQALALDPTDEWAALALAESLLAMRRYSEAAGAAEAAIALSDGRESAMHFAAGSAYFGLNDWTGCARAFRRADELTPEATAAAFNAGLCLARQGYYREAARWMERVLERDPRRRDRGEIAQMIQVWRGG